MMNSKKRNNNFILSLGIYLLIFLVVPFVYHLYNPEEFLLKYRGMNDFSSLVYIIIIVIVFIQAYNLTSYKSPKVSFPTLVFNTKLIKVLTILFLIVSVYFYINFSFKFRHTGEGLTAAGSNVIVLTLLKIFFKTYLFTSLVFYLKNKKRLNKWYIYIVIALCFWLSKSGSTDIPMIFVSLLFAFNKYSFLIKSEFVRTYKIKIFNNFFVRFLLIFTLGIGIIFMGFANKIGFDNAQDVFSSQEGYFKVINSTILRVSTHYASNFGAYKAYEENSYTITEALSGTWNNMFSRANYLLTGKNVERDRIWSINRANYLNLFNDNYKDKTGASPGIFATIYYTNNIFIGILLVGLYIIFIVKILKISLQNDTLKFNFTGYLICMFFIIPLFESPFDIINIFNTSFVYLYFTIIPLLKINYDKSLKITPF